MPRRVFLSAISSAMALWWGATWPAAAQRPQDQTPEARCVQLIAYYDRYGSSRGGNSDGVRNHTRIAALIDCERGDYAAGIEEMEALLKRKAFSVPPLPS